MIVTMEISVELCSSEIGRNENWRTSRVPLRQEAECVGINAGGQRKVLRASFPSVKWGSRVIS